MDDYRIGSGYDIHRLVRSGVFILGNVGIDFKKGFKAHSDGDVLIHSLIDALLGASGSGDIGRHFSDKDPQFKGINSAILLQKVKVIVEEKGFSIVNADITVICEKPKLAPHIESINSRLAELLGVERERINVKAKTKEKCDAAGKGRAVEVYSTVLLKR